MCLVKGDDRRNGAAGMGRAGKTGVVEIRLRAEMSSLVQHLPADWPPVLGVPESPFHLGPTEGLRELARTSEA